MMQSIYLWLQQTENIVLDFMSLLRNIIKNLLKHKHCLLLNARKFETASVFSLVVSSELWYHMYCRDTVVAGPVVSVTVPLSPALMEVSVCRFSSPKISISDHTTYLLKKNMYYYYS